MYSGKIHIDTNHNNKIIEELKNMHQTNKFTKKMDDEEYADTRKST